MSENKIFVFDQITVFFKHIDVSGKVAHSNYFDWAGFAREAYFQDTVSNFREVVSRPIKMMTVYMTHDIFEDAEFGDKIEVHLTTSKIKKFSFEMLLKYYRSNDKKLLCEGKQRVVFVDSRSEKFTFIPKEMMDVIVFYREELS